MPIEPENLIEELVTESVHHREDDDQRGDAKHDAEEGKPGDNRDESLFAPGAQIARGKHPFIWREWPCLRDVAHCPALAASGPRPLRRRYD